MSDAPAIVVLAAGASTRMGTPKQLLPWRDGVPLVRCQAETALAARLGPVSVVVGADAAACREALAGLPIAIVENDAWREGMAASIRAGLAAALAADPTLATVLLLLGDQPLVDAAGLRALAAARGPAHVAAAAHDGARLGPPALFARALFPRLAALRGDAGARALLRDPALRVAAVPWPEAAVDLDTPGDVAHARDRERRS
jgi:molybdenum cofactor cytidylyltransferase